MSPTDTTRRASSQIKADIAQKRSRQAALEKRLEESGEELERLRAAQGRALADGTDEPNPAELQAAANMRDSLRRALGVLADDLKQLEGESKASAIEEAEIHEQQCIEAAVKQVEALEDLIRKLAESRVIPAADKLLEAIREARLAQNECDRLAGPQAGYVPDRVATAVHHHHAKLFKIVDVLRAFASGKALPVGSGAAAPRGEEKPAVALS